MRRLCKGVVATAVSISLAFSPVSVLGLPEAEGDERGSAEWSVAYEGDTATSDDSTEIPITSDGVSETTPSESVDETTTDDQQTESAEGVDVEPGESSEDREEGAGQIDTSDDVDNTEEAIGQADDEDNESQSEGDETAPEVTAQASTTKPSITYRAHVQNVGWQSKVGEGKVAGTSGRSLRVEAFEISLSGKDIPSGGVEYRSHVQKIGWQGWVKDGKTSGTTGRSLRIEAFQMRLYGDVANAYDIYYRVHVQSIGWMGWAKNGELSGTAGKSLRMEAVEVRLVKRGDAAPSNAGSLVSEAYRGAPAGLAVQAHVQSIGWQSAVGDGGTAGTTGRSLRVEALKMSFSGSGPSGGIRYQTHVQSIGWQDWAADGSVAGTSGRSLRIEALKAELTGALAKNYDLYYRVHVQNIGWMAWAKNGEVSGTTGCSYRVEAVQVRCVEKGSAAPSNSDAATGMHYVAGLSVDFEGLRTWVMHTSSSMGPSGESELLYRYSWAPKGGQRTVFSDWSETMTAKLTVDDIGAKKGDYELVLEEKDRSGQTFTNVKTVHYDPSKGTPQDLLDAAKGDIGYSVYTDKETGSKFGRWYEQNVDGTKNNIDFGADDVAYCVMAVSYWMCKASVNGPGLPRAGCEGVYFAALEDGRTVNKQKLEPGMLVLYDWDADGLPDHIGIVEKAIDTNSIQTIEGNTSSGVVGSQDNGGVVARRERGLEKVLCGVTPYYK